MKKIVYLNEARDKMLSGIEKLANTVNITLGPKGNNVALKTSFMPATIINDGVSIVKEVELEDDIENLGAQIIKEAALKTNDTVGDGTTTATILAHNMVKMGIKYIQNGANAMQIRSGMNKTLKECEDILKKLTTKVESNEQIKEIATISSGSNEIGNIISKAIEMVGREGVVTIGESKTTSTKLNIVDGLKFNSGYISSYMLGDSISEKEEAENPYILVTDRKIISVNEILPVIEKVSQTHRPLVLIVDDIDGEALATLIINKVRGTFNSIAVKAPSFGEERINILKDICTTTGAKYIDSNSINKMENIGLEDLGEAKTVVISKEDTIILRGKANEEELTKNIEKTKIDILNETKAEEREKLKRKLARLLGGIAVIEVGANTQTEQNEKKLRIEDALSATHAAIEEGIVAGGGKTYINISNELNSFANILSGDEKIGANIIIKSLEKPQYYIAQNSGVNGDVIVEKVKEKDENIGYDALTGEFVDMKKSGIIDPTKVERIALESAISISSMIITTNAVVCEVEDKK